MHIQRGRPEEIPPDAIRLTKIEVFQYMTDLIRKWPSTSEVWALKLGNPILSSAVVVSSAVILNFYRTRLKLRNYGRFTLFLPVVIVPSIFNQVYQNTTVTKSIILQEDCVTCIATESMLLQLGLGIVYPWMTSIGGTYMFAHKMGTVDGYSSGFKIYKEFTKHLIKTSGPIYNRVTAFVIGHVLLSYAIVNYQTKNMEFLKIKLIEQDDEDREKLRESSNKTKNRS